MKRLENDECVEYLYNFKSKEIKEYHNRNTDEESIYPNKVMDIIGDKTKDDAVYFTDVGQHKMRAVQYILHTKPRSFITSGGLGTIGYGAVLRAKAAKPDRKIIHIIWDGSFYMNLNEAAASWI